MSHDRVAVLGAGMLGVCTALELARRGRHVLLIDAADDVLRGASRWNEGKIHLGFLYAADPSLNTVRRLIPGGLAFADFVARHLGRSVASLEGFATGDDVFLVHRDSVVDVESFALHAERTMDLIRDAASVAGSPAYLTNLRDARVHRLNAAELAEITSSPDVLAGFRVPERSLSTVAIADLLRDAVRAEPRIELRVATRVDRVERRDDGDFDVCTTTRGEIERSRHRIVVNALWEGRPAVDATLGIAPPAPWTHRFRAALFGRAPTSRVQTGVLCTGPFGDIKRYADGRLYLSWYPAGLLAQGQALEPPRAEAVLTPERRSLVMQRALKALASFFPGVAELADCADELEVQGGWVYAVGEGSLADRASTLHRRDKFNVTVNAGYISVDTAKYSLAPWLAEQVAHLVDGAE